MEQNQKIAIIGGTGKVGKHIAKIAVEHGYNVRLLIRNPEKVTFRDDRIEIVQGDAKDNAAIKALLEGCQIVINTFGQPVKAEQLYSRVTEQILSVMNEFGISRYIGVTGGSLTVAGDQKSIINKLGAKLFEVLFSKMMIDKKKELHALEKSKVEWTLVRLPFVVEGMEKGIIKENLFDMPGSTITNTDIARFLIRQIDDKKYLRKIPFIAG
ncbi:NAD(P)H-binding protein [Bacillus sp. Bva_UNVM-123]|uniref:NAD(P)-dependent oxidoreductase n=1 Tax=Bacillus sp. Bva_UNVM-123 TaxID=2829798 RepID=UPI00391F1F3C